MLAAAFKLLFYFYETTVLYAFISFLLFLISLCIVICHFLPLVGSQSSRLGRVSREARAI